jgi:hypothetical protein
MSEKPLKKKAIQNSLKTASKQIGLPDVKVSSGWRIGVSN